MVISKITSVEHLKSVLFDEWLKVPSEVVKNMIESMPKCVAEYTRLPRNKPCIKKNKYILRLCEFCKKFKNHKKQTATGPDEAGNKGATKYVALCCRRIYVQFVFEFHNTISVCLEIEKK
ncbi:hypothetical protein BpHYR1_040826 [Brachionus plicatilis]|uniref:Uncharacterized protein n=1 Tax=Brachionus plicatilis TaxID=10195 RepID=A0A3M7S0C5_BRAPC|nr:hypothetical protein BpHYR1_040826 [Brachionus plicatilis]